MTHLISETQREYPPPPLPLSHTHSTLVGRKALTGSRMDLVSVSILHQQLIKRFICCLQKKKKKKLKIITLEQNQSISLSTCLSHPLLSLYLSLSLTPSLSLMPFSLLCLSPRATQRLTNKIDISRDECIVQISGSTGTLHTVPGTGGDNPLVVGHQLVLVVESQRPTPIQGAL